MDSKASSPAGQNHRGPVREEHVAQWLWSAFASEPASVWLTAEESVWAIEHLRVCETCRAEIGVLANMASAAPDLSPALSAILTHFSARSTQDAVSGVGGASGVVPDDEDLAMYVALLQVSGEAAARRESPDVWAHIALCPICQAEVASIRDVLADEQPVAAEQQSLWERPSAWERRLRAPYQVWIRPRELRITSALTNPQIEPPKGISDPLSGERFTVAFRDDTAGVPEEWVNVEVEMHALFAQRIACQIHAVRTSEGASTIPADGVPWRLESVAVSEEEAPTRSGTRNTTNSDGTATFSITGVGDYEIIITIAGLDWIVPLAIRTDTSGDQ